MCSTFNQIKKIKFSHPRCVRKKLFELFLAVLGAVIIFSCAGTKHGLSPYHGLGNREQIYSLVFDSLLGPDSVRHGPLINEVLFFMKPYSVPPDSFPGIAHRYEDSARHLPDSILLRVCLQDYYGPIRAPEEKWLSLYKLYRRVDSPEKFSEIDAEFCVALQCWARTNAVFACDPALIHSRYAYRPVRLQVDLDEPNLVARFVIKPTLVFSHIGYNFDSTKAVVFADHSGYCGGNFWYLAKEHGDWFVFAQGAD
jgi:hypothetical protein